KAYGKKFSPEQIDALVDYIRSVQVAPSMASDGIDGAKLFSKKCKMCHAINKKKTGPSLVSMHQDESVLRDVITKGSSKKRMMKAYGKKFSPEQIEALVGYIRSVQK
ncbi:MAG: cytochrome c, partial [Mariprofundus sp.]|nr:cytochrome c [Mariprofundus sp.]